MAEFLRPRQPIIGYLYFQDKFELQDIVLNLGSGWITLTSNRTNLLIQHCHVGDLNPNKI